jgi:hypothetical protein
MDTRTSYQRIGDKKSDVQDRWTRLTHWRVRVVKSRMAELTKSGMDKLTAFKQATKEMTEGKLDKY